MKLLLEYIYVYVVCVYSRIPCKILLNYSYYILFLQLSRKWSSEEDTRSTLKQKIPFQPRPHHLRNDVWLFLGFFHLAKGSWWIHDLLLWSQFLVYHMTFTSMNIIWNYEFFTMFSFRYGCNNNKLFSFWKYIKIWGYDDKPWKGAKI